MRIICAIAFILGVTYGANAQFRTYSNEFLNIGAGARALGMGGANIASVSGAAAGYWNPARLTTVKEIPNLAIMHTEYFSGIGKYDYASIALPVNDNKRTIGVSLLRFAIDDIPNTLYLVKPDGSVNYNDVETFSSADYALMVSMAQVLKEGDDFTLSAGGNVKVIHRSIGSFAKAWGFGIDAGIHFEKRQWKFGAVLRDVTTTFNAWSFNFTEREKQVLYLTNNDIPQQSTELTAPRLVLGASYDFKFGENLQLTTEGMIETTFDGKRNTILKTSFASIDPRAGLELSYKDLIFVRAGISNFQQALKDGDITNQQKVWIYQPALGAGFKVKSVSIDYAFTNLANQNSPLYTHVFSLSLDLKKKDK
ncbi:MAG: PorV/PorQ family protein [Bacteroidota bacterium]